MQLHCIGTVTGKTASIIAHADSSPLVVLQISIIHNSVASKYFFREHALL